MISKQLGIPWTWLHFHEQFICSCILHLSGSSSSEDCCCKILYMAEWSIHMSNKNKRQKTEKQTTNLRQQNHKGKFVMFCNQCIYRKSWTKILSKMLTHPALFNYLSSGPIHPTSKGQLHQWFSNFFLLPPPSPPDQNASAPLFQQTPERQ